MTGLKEILKKYKDEGETGERKDRKRKRDEMEIWREREKKEKRKIQKVDDGRVVLWIILINIEKEEVKNNADNEIELIKQRLQQKAKLYDQLILNRGQQDKIIETKDTNDDYLVNFEEKLEKMDEKKETKLNDEFHKYKIIKRK